MQRHRRTVPHVVYCHVCGQNERGEVYCLVGIVGHWWRWFTGAKVYVIPSSTCCYRVCLAVRRALVCQVLPVKRVL